MEQRKLDPISSAVSLMTMAVAGGCLAMTALFLLILVLAILASMAGMK